MRARYFHRVNPKVEGAIGLVLILIGLLLFLLFFTSCTRLAKQLGVAQKKTEAAKVRVDGNTQTFVKAAVDSMRFVEDSLPTNTLPETLSVLRIGIKYGELAERNIGLPVYSVDFLAEARGAKQALEAARILESASTINLATRNELAQAELDRLKGLAKLGERYERERNENIVKKGWRGFKIFLGVGTFGGIIYLLVITGAIFVIGPPLLGWLYELALKIFPKLVNFLRVVPVKTFRRVTASVELAKRNNAQAKYAVEKVGEKILDENEKTMVRDQKIIGLRDIAEQDKQKAKDRARTEEVASETEQLLRTNGGPIGRPMEPGK